jgi:hypothetical protein
MEKISRKLKYIGYYQLVGGIIGVLSTTRFLPNFTLINGGIFLIFLLIFALYSYSIYCGYLLIKKRNIKGINLSIYNQLIQIIGFGVLGFAFHFTAGVYAGIKLNLTNDTILTFMFGHSAAMININSNHEYTELSLNIIALILLNIILNLKTKLEKIEQIEIEL